MLQQFSVQERTTVELEMTFARDQYPRDATVRVQDCAEHNVGIDDELHFNSRLRFFAYHVRLTSAARSFTTFCGTL
jgi:hypothetical protein